MSVLDLSSLRFDSLIAREWIVANGNGGYASSTLASMNTRKYHGLLCAAMAPPARRMVLLSRVEETVRFEGESFDLAVNEYPGTVHPRGHEYLRAFSHQPFPRWAYQGEGWTIEKQLRPLLRENTVVISYTLLGGDQPLDLEMRPLFALRPIHDLMYQWNGRLEARSITRRHHRIPASCRSPEAFFAHDGAFSPLPCWYLNTIYRREQERGYAGLEDLWMPGAVRWKISPGQTVNFVCSTDPIDTSRVLQEADRQLDAAVPPLLINRADPALEALIAAAEQFVVQARDGTPSIISAYPWDSAAGRDAMIALPGLLLVTGRLDEAKLLLRAFARSMRQGLMPSDLAEDGSGHRYHAADTSLWFINALWQYHRYGGDQQFIFEMLAYADTIIEMYMHGAPLGIGADADGLLHTHAPGIPTTWMDAKVGEWVITPRQGRPVCLNALWYNAIRITAALAAPAGRVDRAEQLNAIADRVKDSFNRRFWNPDANCCFDVVEDHGNDPSIRPNQVLALSLPFPVLDPSRHALVLERLEKELLTPLGLRTLSPADPSYQGAYAGPVVSRDRAHHQGSAFPWLLGPYITATLRLGGRGDAPRQHARKLLEGCLDHLRGPGTGHICELFDGNAPHNPGGSPASARSTAELLRAYVEEILDLNPAPTHAAPHPVPPVSPPAEPREPDRSAYR